MQRLHCFSTSKHLLDAPRSSVLGPSFQLLQDLLQIYKPPTPKEAVMKALPSARVYSHPKKLAQQTHPVSSSSFCFKHVLVVLGAVVLWTKCRLAINMLLVHEVRWSIKITWEAWNCRITHHIHSLDILSFLTLPDLKNAAKCSHPVSLFCFPPVPCPICSLILLAATIHYASSFSAFAFAQDPGGTSPEYLAAALTSAATSPRRKHQRLGLGMLRRVVPTIIQALRKRDWNWYQSLKAKAAKVAKGRAWHPRQLPCALRKRPVATRVWSMAQLSSLCPKRKWTNPGPPSLSCSVIQGHSLKIAWPWYKSFY